LGNQGRCGRKALKEADFILNVPESDEAILVGHVCAECGSLNSGQMERLEPHNKSQAENARLKS
jgi:hypothetical protein